MYRPCFLVVDHEYPGSVSSRKLVLETAKFNVVTAYSNDESIETLRRFPKVDGVVLNAHAGGNLSCSETAFALHRIVPGIPILVTSAQGHADCGSAQYHVSGFDPKLLLDQLEKIYQERTAEMAEHERKLREALEGSS